MNDIQYKLGIQYSKEAINRLEQSEKEKNDTWDKINIYDKKLQDIDFKSKTLKDKFNLVVSLDNAILNSNSIGVISKTTILAIPKIDISKVIDGLKKVIDNISQRISSILSKEDKSEIQSKEPQGNLSWDSFNQTDETHNENVIKNPYKVEGCTPISKKIDRPTNNEHNHDSRECQ